MKKNTLVLMMIGLLAMGTVYISVPEPAQAQITTPSWERIEGNWNEFAGKAREQWGKLTDDDIAVIKGQRQQLLGKLQIRYGIAKEEAEQQVAEWQARVTK